MPMDRLLISAVGIVAFLAVYSKGVQWAFRWVVLPTLVLIPNELVFDVAGLPDVTARRTAYVGVIAGAIVAGRTCQLIPRWRWFDVLALAPVLSFSFSFGMDTDFKGFYHRLALLTMEWACPYLLARAALSGLDQVRAALRPLALCSTVLAGLAVYECRMGTRLAVNLWDSLGFDVHVLWHAGYWRWGYLRAVATFGEPIALGTFFATVTPLMALWGLLEPKVRWMPRIAAVACIAGCVACLSRGPMLVLIAVALVFYLLAVPKRSLVLISIAVVMIAVGPFVIEGVQDEARFVQTEMDLAGNTTSGHYRVALLFVYGKRILDVGFWGDREVRASPEYEKAWSIDNAYLFLFLAGGWLGGGAFCLMVVILLYLGGRKIIHTNGHERKILAAAVASFAAIAGCMGNVWFAPTYAPLFWLTAGLVLNLSNTIPVADQRLVRACP